MEKSRARFLFLAFGVGLMLVDARAQLVIFSFGSSGSPTLAATSTAPDVSASNFSGAAGSPGTGSGSPVYTAGSGGSFFSASSWTGSAPGVNYFEFTLTPDAGRQITVSSLSFGYRSTSTGPTSFALRTSTDSFASSLTTGSLTNDANWTGTGTVSFTPSAFTGGTTFRIYASGASSALGTFRVDDVTLNGSVSASAVPEPAAFAAVSGCGAAIAAMLLRRRRRRPGASVH